jgi:hypothetical protein
MTAHSTIDVANLASTAPARLLTNGLRAAAAALLLMAATPAFAKQGTAQDMLADGGDYGVTNTGTGAIHTANGGDYGVTNTGTDAGTGAIHTANGGDYVVTNGHG